MSESPWSLFSPFSQTFGRFVNNPVTDWHRFYSPQVIFNYNPEDEPVEAHVLSKVGSYGSQLSTLIDVIEILLGRLDKKRLTDAQTKALDEFAELRVRSDLAVDEARGLSTPDAIADAVESLVKRHPDKLPELKTKLDELLAAK